MNPIKAIKIKENMKVSELVEGMGGMGFGAGKIAKASNILAKMFKDNECKIFLGVAGAMIPAGMKEVIIDLLDNVDVVVTTGGNLTHDLIESLGEKHYHGEEPFDDEKLNKMGIDRIYNVFMKNEVYGKLEDFFEEHFDEFSKCTNIKEFLWKIGELVSESPPTHPNRKSFAQTLAPTQTNDAKISSPQLKGILAKCYEKQIPIFCPGIADSGIGLMMWGRIAKGKKSNIDVFSDMNEIIDIAWTSKKTGVIYVGGGLPKNFVQQSLQFAKGADYGIQITTDSAEPGGSSGAPLKEGISWGKMNKNADFVDVFCDATIALPLIYGAVKC